MLVEYKLIWVTIGLPLGYEHYCIYGRIRIDWVTSGVTSVSELTKSINIMDELVYLLVYSFEIYLEMKEIFIRL